SFFEQSQNNVFVLDFYLLKMNIHCFYLVCSILNPQSEIINLSEFSANGFQWLPVWIPTTGAILIFPLICPHFHQLYSLGRRWRFQTKPRPASGNKPNGTKNGQYNL